LRDLTTRKQGGPTQAIRNLKGGGAGRTPEKGQVQEVVGWSVMGNLSNIEGDRCLGVFSADEEGGGVLGMKKRSVYTTKRETLETQKRVRQNGSTQDVRLLGEKGQKAALQKRKSNDASCIPAEQARKKKKKLRNQGARTKTIREAVGGGQTW